MTATCPNCGAEGFRMDTPGPYYRCDTEIEECRVRDFRAETSGGLPL